MARKAHEISADKLSERLPVHDADDEFGRLALAFNDTLERLERSFERQRRFTADASHELRTPLAIIRSIGENALQPPSDAARHADAIGRILEEADRLTRLLDGLLTLTRAEAGQFPLRMEELDLASLCREVGECMQVLAEEKNQHMLVEAPHPVHVTADGAAIKLALLNLVSNAIRYTPAQGKIAICSCVAQDDHAVIEVRDNGPGIAPEHHVMIFERFYRVDPDRSRETGGVGLGLAIAKWAVNLNGGRIELESEVNAGSLFRIRMLLSSVSKGK
jgi:signal transduction histidine kinase